MAYTKYSLTPSSNTAAPPDGAPEGMLPSAVNDTMRDMMAQIRDCGDGIRDGTYTMTAPKITGGTITGAAFTGNTFTSPVISGGTINNATIGATTATTGKFTTLEATGVATFSAGAVGTPAITTTGDTNTGIFFPAADTIAFAEGGAEAMRIDSSGNVGIGTSSPSVKLQVNGATTIAGTIIQNAELFQMNGNGNADLRLINTAGTTSRRAFDWLSNGDNLRARLLSDDGSSLLTDNLLVINWNGNVGVNCTPDSKFKVVASGANLIIGFSGTQNYFDASENIFRNFAGTERMRIDASGFVMVGTTNTNPAENNVKGVSLGQDGRSLFSAMGTEVVRINRGTDDGVLVWFHQAGVAEGNISVSGSTVSYNGGHLSRWSQLPDGSKDESIVKGTVMSNLDDMCVWEKDGVVAENEQLNKMKVSDVEGDTNVAGVFVNWTIDEQYGVDDMNVAMTGDMIIRIAEGVVVQKGDLLMSAGDGTAKPQGDDIRRSKTVAKVTSNHVTCTYADGSYCVPCVLMAC